MLEDGDKGKGDVVEVELLQNKQLTTDGYDNNGVKTKVLVRSNPVFRFENRSTKVKQYSNIKIFNS